MRSFGVLAVIFTGCATTAAHERAATVVRVESACADGILSSLDRWSTEVLGPPGQPPYPAVATKLVVQERGALRVLPVPREVPGHGGRRFDRVYGGRVDRDGTFVFTGEYRRGRGIFRWQEGRVAPLVDSPTFCVAGAPAVHGGRVAFTTCGGTNAMGVFLWTPRGIITVVDRSTTLSVSGLAKLRNGRVLFRGEEDDRQGLFLWSGRPGAFERVLAAGDVLPGTVEDRVDEIEDYAITDSTVTAIVTSQPIVTGVGRLVRRHLVWIRAGRLASIFRDLGSLPAPRFTVDGDAVAFELRTRGDPGRAERSSVWYARGCNRERVLASGQALAGATIASVHIAPPLDGSLVGDSLFLSITLSNGESVLARARRQHARGESDGAEAHPLRAFADRVAPHTLGCSTDADCSMLESGRCCQGFCEADAHGPSEGEDPARACVP